MNLQQCSQRFYNHPVSYNSINMSEYRKHIEIIEALKNDEQRELQIIYGVKFNIKKASKNSLI